MNCFVALRVSRRDFEFRHDAGPAAHAASHNSAVYQEYAFRSYDENIERWSAFSRKRFQSFPFPLAFPRLRDRSTFD